MTPKPRGNEPWAQPSARVKPADTTRAAQRWVDTHEAPGHPVHNGRRPGQRTGSHQRPSPERHVRHTLVRPAGEADTPQSPPQQPVRRANGAKRHVSGNRGVGGPGDRPSSYGSQTGAKAPFPESAPSLLSNGDRTVEASSCTTNSAKSKITVSQIATPGVR